ncbi:MAG: hypothetical protein K0R38_7629 [Polyangiaceae bacterium]|nr:hypothetical protein [Polyangiaceae bacterium]
MAFLGFFNDGTDQDGDGIVDDLEINVQVLCSDPRKLYLTVFTDNEELRFRKRSRLVDFATGEQFGTHAAIRTSSSQRAQPASCWSAPSQKVAFRSLDSSGVPKSCASSCT